MFVLERLINNYKINRPRSELSEEEQKFLVNSVMRYKLLNMKNPEFHLSESDDEKLNKEFQNAIKRIIKFESLRGKLMKL